MFQLKKVIFIFCLSLFLLLSEANAGVLRLAGLTRKISGLNFSSVTYETLPQENGLDPKTKKPIYRYTALVTGNFARPGWNVVWYIAEGLTLTQMAGSFSIAVPVLKEKMNITLRAVGVHGEVEQTVLTVVHSKEDLPKPVSNSRHSFSISASATQIFYSESAFDSFKQSAVTFKGAWNYNLMPGKWDFEISSYFTVWPLMKNAEQDIRFLGINARFGYTTQLLKKPWMLKFLFGYYYLTTFVAGDEFGYKNLMGPAVFPSLVRFLDKGRSIYTYFKFSPVQSEFGLSARMYELAAGGGYSMPLSDGRTISYGVDLSRLSLPFEDGYLINSYSMNFGVTLKW